MKTIAFLAALLAAAGASALAAPLKLVPHPVSLADGRIFVTDMHDRTDNRKGAVYILDGFDPEAGRFKSVAPYLTGLRNPNSVAFYTDPQGKHWLYLALTDRLVRYSYQAGDSAPTSEPQVLATFPDYGLNYKYGGWHLTRTVAIGPNGKVYVSVGSSCNACEEKEAVRASILELDPDGGPIRHYARGLRNAVGLRWVGDKLFATNMGADHLGDHKPADTFYEIRDGANYGWPYCYQSWRKVYTDPKYNPAGKKTSCREVPVAYAAFDAHSSPLGFEAFDAKNGPELAGSFLVALHGSTKKSLGHGYRIARVSKAGTVPEDFITGFLKDGKILVRPADVMSVGPDAFLMTDDYAGVVYFVSKTH
jgi:glucose/arabinose dehydrogenase